MGPKPTPGYGENDIDQDYGLDDSVLNDMDVDDNEGVVETGDNDQSTSSSKVTQLRLPALVNFFMERLVESIVECNGDPSLVKQIKIDIYKKKGGFCGGMIDVYYIEHNDATKKKKIKSRVELLAHLSLMPNYRTSKNMTKKQVYMMSIESREKTLMAQLIALSDGRCDELRKVGNELKLLINDSNDGSITYAEIPNGNAPYFFSYGNITILSWGKISNLPGFHVSNLIYPVGFKCIRQEHDMFSDRIVDCLCEIDTFLDTPGEGEAISEKRLLPLFRLTVGWKLDSSDKETIRVYEARSPQQAWQAAMLESIGIKEYDSLAQPSSFTSDNPTHTFGSQLVYDEEEQELRSEIRELRRSYFRALRHEQSSGHKAAIKPRLWLETVDSFFDDGIMRLIEGMEGSHLCKLYQFLDHRDNDFSQKKVVQGLRKTFTKLKTLEKVYSRDTNAPPAVSTKNSKQMENKKRKRDGKELTTFDITKTLTFGERDGDKFRNTYDRKGSLKSKSRDIEKKIKELRDECMKYLKTRRVEAKLRVEIVCDREEAVKVSMPSSKPIGGQCDDFADLKERPNRPESKSNITSFIDSSVFGQVFEVWNFLMTYSQIMNIEEIPNFKRLCVAILAMDNEYQDIFAASNQPLSQAKDVCDDNDFFFPRDSAKDLMNQIGMAMCQVMLRDFQKVMGIEINDHFLSALKNLLNELTWKEIARVMIIHVTCRELGMADADLTILLKGKGYAHTAEGSDRRHLRLIRRRIAFAYSIRNENQESIYGFKTGNCVRIPAPSLCLSSRISWGELLVKVSSIPNKKSSVIYGIITSAIVALRNSFPSSFEYKVVNALRACLQPPIFNIADASASKTYVENILKVCFPNGVSRSVSKSDDDIVIKTPFQLLRTHQNVFQRYCTVSSNNEFIEIDTDDCIENELIVDYDPSAKDIDTALNMSGIIDDSQMAEQLSVAMQRCYIVIRDLMTHPLAIHFLDLLDPRANVSYFKLVAQPTSLSHVRKHLVGGFYDNSIYKFYMDVNLVLENAITANNEQSIIAVSAYKIMAIFERTFMETVLSFDNPSMHNECCILCKQHDQYIMERGTICDRCECMYHPTCLNPPLSSPPRLEWFCPGCVEQRGIAFVHPNNTSHVNHPSIKGFQGEVVGIEQIKQTARFVVEFKGKGREMWSGSKIRQNLVESEKQVVLPSGYSFEDFDLVCGFARGYGGWGAPHTMVQSYLSAAHSNPSRAKGQHDPFFEKYRDTIATLGHLSDYDDMGADEWSTLFRALAQLCMTTASFQEKTEIFDDEIESAISACSEAILAGNTSIENLVRQSAARCGENFVIAPIVKASKNLFHDISAKDILEGAVPPKKFGRPRKVVVVAADEDDEDNVSDLFPNDEETETDSDNNHNDNDTDEDKEEQDDDESINSLLDELDDETVSDGGNDFVKPKSNRGHVPRNTGPSNAFNDDFDEAFALWDSKRLARKNGREDALVMHNVVEDVYTQISYFSQQDVDSDNNHAIMVASSARACIARPNDGHCSNEWADSINRKLMRIADFEASSSQTLCSYCGFDEVFLASPLVYAQTWEEWEDEGDSAFAVIQDRRRKPKEQGASHKSWLPCDKDDAIIEKQEFSMQSKMVLRKGSVVAHEYCADCMNHMRQGALNRVGMAENRRIIDIIVGLGRAKSTPIGTDSQGDIYWIFSGASVLFVSSPNDKTKSANNNSNSKDPMAAFLEGVNRYVSDEKVVDNRSFNCTWRVYETPADIGRVIEWLSVRNPLERYLKRVLQLLFPNCVDAAKANTASVDTMKEKLMEDLNDLLNIDESADGINGVINDGVESVMEIEGSEVLSQESYDRNKSCNRTGDLESEEAEWSDGEDSVEKIMKRTDSLAAKSPFSYGKFKIGEKVAVTNESNGVVWEARILSLKSIRNGSEGQSFFYKVKFDKWPSEYDSWIVEENISEYTKFTHRRVSDSREAYLQEKVATAPQCLQSLRACEYVDENDRAYEDDYPVLSYSNKNTEISLIRYALLLVEAALPMGCIDTADDKFGENFVLAWREAVMASTDASSLMQCQIFLESCIRAKWLKQKLMLAMPSRLHALRNATLSQVALRVWVLDQALKYDKVELLPGVKKGKSRK